MIDNDRTQIYHRKAFQSGAYYEFVQWLKRFAQKGDSQFLS